MLFTMPCLQAQWARTETLLLPVGISHLYSVHVLYFLWTDNYLGCSCPTYIQDILAQMIKCGLLFLFLFSNSFNSISMVMKRICGLGILCVWAKPYVCVVGIFLLNEIKKLKRKVDSLCHPFIFLSPVSSFERSLLTNYINSVASSFNFA